MWFQIAFENDPDYENIIVPLGVQCVLLNDETMLVGMWGKIILAYKH